MERLMKLPRRQSPRFITDYAHDSVKLRIPVILTMIIDQMSQKRLELIRKNDEAMAENMKQFLSKMSELRYRIQTNKYLRQFEDINSLSPSWNDILNTFEMTPKWFEMSWLFIECYFYASVQQAWESCNMKEGTDVFRACKERSYVQSYSGIVYITNWSCDQMKDGSYSRNVFKQVMQLSLWGNRFDLSISGGKDNHNEELDPVHMLQELSRELLHSDLDAVYDYIVEKEGDVHIDLVLDNAGYELVSDLVLSVYMLKTGMVKSICLHGKAMPWFISDVTEHDFHWTIERFAKCKKISTFHGIIRDLIDAKKLTFECHSFWTTSFPFHDMAYVSPDLYNKLNESSLVIYKGDLNYRKLLDDRNWQPFTTTLEEALTCRGRWPTKGALLTIRTVKSEALVGVTEPTYETMVRESNDWYSLGKYAVIQFVDWSKRKRDTNAYICDKTIPEMVRSWEDYEITNNFMSESSFEDCAIDEEVPVRDRVVDYSYE